MTRINVRIEPNDLHVIGTMWVQNPMAPVLQVRHLLSNIAVTPVSDYELTTEVQWSEYEIRTYSTTFYLSRERSIREERCLMVPSVHPIMNEATFQWSEGLLATRREIAMLLMRVRQPDMYEVSMRDPISDPYEFFRLDQRESSTIMCNLINEYTDRGLRGENVIGELTREVAEFLACNPSLVYAIRDMACKVEEVSKTIPYPDVLNVVRRIDIGE